MVLFEAMEENLRATMAAFGRANQAGETCELPGVAVTSSGVHFAMFNSALLTAPVTTTAELDQRIREAARFFAERRMPWSFWLCEAWFDKAMRGKVGGVFDYNGMQFVIEMPGMVAERLVPPWRELPALAVEPVRDGRTRADFGHIMAGAFGIPVPVAQAIYESERTWGNGFRGYVGYVEGLPVCSTATFETASATGVYAVGTLPPYRHRGYAEAVMRHALAQVPADSTGGCLVLESSEAGFALYEKMGYRTEARYAVFAT
jgi:GNAT superfamily N-acetyltransferase